MEGTEGLQSRLAGSWVLSVVHSVSLGSPNKSQEFSRPCDLGVSTLLVCGSCVRSITQESEIRGKHDKGRQGEEYSRSSRSKCSWKIKAPNKNQQNGKKANRQSKA